MQEVEKLLIVGFIREVYYPEWLANVIMVKKSNEKWRICIDFTDLNRACLKDSFPLPKIDQLVDSNDFASYIHPTNNINKFINISWQMHLIFIQIQDLFSFSNIAKIYYCSSAFWVSRFFIYFLFFLVCMNSSQIVHAHGFSVQETKCTIQDICAPFIMW